MKASCQSLEGPMSSSLLRCVDMVKSSQHVELANDLEIHKAITYLRQKDFNQVSVFVRTPSPFRRLTPVICEGPQWQRRGVNQKHSQL